MCSYFKDPLVCIGPVATDQVKQIVQYTAGEKRITGQGNRVYKRHPYLPWDTDNFLFFPPNEL